MGSYLRLMQAIVPEAHYQEVFHDNALRIFQKLNGLLPSSSSTTL